MSQVKLGTGLSPNYVKGWDVTKGIRELLQNYLDSRQEFGCDGSVTYDGHRAWIRDFGPGLEARHLAIGVSEKGADAKGKFGEGLKLALLVLAREGRNPEIQTRGKTIRPRIANDPGYGTEVMVLEVEGSARMQGAGTLIRFECTREELDAAKTYFIEFRAVAGFEWVEQGKISRPGGYVYVNGTRIGGLDEAMYSYHLNGEQAVDAGNRDREVVDRDKVTPAIADLIARTGSIKVKQEILQTLADKKHPFEANLHYDYYGTPREVRRQWLMVVRQVFGANAVLTTQNADQDKGAEYRGYRVINYLPWAWLCFLQGIGVRTARSVLADAAKTIPHLEDRDLADVERLNLALAVRLVEEHYAPVGDLKIAETLQPLVGKDSAGTVLGLWVTETKTIWLRRSVLASSTDTLETLLHEAVHKHTGTKDCTEQFEQALVQASVALIRKIHYS